MSNVKFTKIELSRLQKMFGLYQRYLPTLQMKKALLQMQVRKADEEIQQLERTYLKEKSLVEGYAKLLSGESVTDCEESVQIEKIHLQFENIAGIEIPLFHDIQFKDPKSMMISQPLWVDDMINFLRNLRKALEKVKVAKQKREILAREFRTVSIRVNLFEKRLLPNLEKDIMKIKVFLNDQDLQGVAQAKVSKRKTLQRKELEEEGRITG
jgi:V/A-type H+-transporting ATPase subunit D